jgi:hypothetical protein
MPWIWTNGSSNRSRRNTRNTRSRRYGGSYGQRSYRNRGNNTPQDDWQEDNDDWDGRFYDQNGRRMSITIATPRDMLPPQMSSAERDTANWPVSRSGFRQRF